MQIGEGVNFSPQPYFTENDLYQYKFSCIQFLARLKQQINNQLILMKKEICARGRLRVWRQKSNQEKKRNQHKPRNISRKQRLEQEFLWHKNYKIMESSANICKNTNTPKFMLKLFFKNYQGVSKRLCNHASQTELHKKLINKIKSFLRSLGPSSKNFDCISLKDFKYLFGKDEQNRQNEEINKLSRRVFLECLRKNYNSIIKKTRVMSLREYMITMKIQMIRCRHPDLVTRIQVKV